MHPRVGPLDPPRDPEMTSKPPLVGLTGGLGAGKSNALAALERLGAATLSTDAVVHDLYRSDEVRDVVVERWGAEVAPGGEVDRSAVAARAFSTSEDRAWLEGVIWPRVGERIAAFCKQGHAADPAPRALVVETPLLFEAGMEALYDARIGGVAAEELRAERAGARGHAAVEERHARELPQDEKAARATFAVVNDGSPEDLERALSEVLVKLGR